jgi:hypothetical protein
MRLSDHEQRLLDQKSGEEMDRRAAVVDLVKTVELARATGFREGIEKAARRTLIHSQYPITTDFDRGYDKARKDAACDIRALADARCAEKAFVEAERDAALARVRALETALEELAELGEKGMKPNYGEWLTFHDKVAQVARSALSESVQRRSPA